MKMILNKLMFTLMLCLIDTSISDEVVSASYPVEYKVENVKPYGFRPRALPLRREDKPVYYAKDNQDNGYKTEILFPGNYYSISKEKSIKKIDEESTRQGGGAFTPQVIPLIRGGFQKRSLDVSEPTLDNPEETSEMSLMKRSISYILGAEDDEDNDDDDDDEFEKEDELSEGDRGNQIKKKIRKKVKRYSKYMMPLLLAYKLKYFALVPVMVAGLVLLVGATGMAGFFFALFAAVMGLQKGGY